MLHYTFFQPYSCIICAHTISLFYIARLKVRNPDSYGWAPKTLLAQLVAIYRHLDSEDDRFALALSKDERCFSRDLFENACTLMSRHGIQTPEELESFACLGAKVNFDSSCPHIFFTVLVPLKFQTTQASCWPFNLENFRSCNSPDVIAAYSSDDAYSVM